MESLTSRSSRASKPKSFDPNTLPTTSKSNLPDLLQGHRQRKLPSTRISKPSRGSGVSLHRNPQTFRCCKASLHQYAAVLALRPRVELVRLHKVLASRPYTGRRYKRIRIQAHANSKQRAFPVGNPRNVDLDSDMSRKIRSNRATVLGNESTHQTALMDSEDTLTTAVTANTPDVAIAVDLSPRSIRLSSPSSLSSVPSELGSIPKGLEFQPDKSKVNSAKQTRSSTPTRRSKRQRQPTRRDFGHERSSRQGPSAKRRRVAERSSEPSRPMLSDERCNESSANSKSDLKDLSLSGSQNSGTLHYVVPLNSGSDVQSKIVIEESNVRSRPIPLKLGLQKSAQALHQQRNSLVELDLIRSFSAKVHGYDHQRQVSEQELMSHFNSSRRRQNVEEDLSFEDRKSDALYPALDRDQLTYFHADGYTVNAASNGAQTGSNNGSEAPSPAPKATKPGQSGKGNKFPGKGGKGNKGRAGGGRDKDSPEPPHRVALTEVESTTLRSIRQRQTDLKKFFNIIALQQKEALNKLAGREMERLNVSKKTRKPEKPKFNEVNEYHEVIKALDKDLQSIQSVIKVEYAAQVALAESNLAAQKEVLHKQERTKLEDLHKEHIKGAQGDLVLFYRAHMTALDETGTSNCSDDQQYLPRYHEMPEPNSQPRGYSSRRILDEKPFKGTLNHLDEQEQRKVIDNEIVAPVVQAIAEDKVHLEAQEEKRARLDNLLTVTRDELRKAGGYLIPRPLASGENPQFALSRLADCAEFVSRAHPTEAYVYMPVAPADIDTFPVHHLEKIPRPIRNDSMPTTVPVGVNTVNQPKDTHQSHGSASLPVKRLSKDESAKDQSTSSTPTALPSIAPAPSRRGSMISNQHHHHRIPSTHMLPPPPTTAPTSIQSRHPSLAPLITSRPMHTSPPATPTFAQTPTTPSYAPLPPSPSIFRGPPPPPGYPPPPPVQSHPQFSPQRMHHPPQQFPPPPQTYRQPASSQPTPLAPTPRPQNQSAPAITPIAQAPQSRPPTTNNTATTNPAPAPRARIGGPRREPGTITFTPTQTPNSERFRNPPSGPAPLPPGQHVYRPNSLQSHANQQNSNRGSTPNQNLHSSDNTKSTRRTSTPTSNTTTPPPGTSGATTSKLSGGQFVNIAASSQSQPHSDSALGAGGDANATMGTRRSQIASETARQNANRNAARGAGPKGGRRVLLPKGF